MTLLKKMNFEDVSQIVIGASVMAIPIAFSEELWRFGETLPSFNLTLLVLLSFIIQTLYIYSSLFQGKEKSTLLIVSRVIINYIITFFTVSAILFVLNRLSFNYEEFIVGFKRILVLTFPASLGGVIIDGLDKE